MPESVNPAGLSVAFCAVISRPAISPPGEQAWWPVSMSLTRHGIVRQRRASAACMVVGHDYHSLSEHHATTTWGQLPIGTAFATIYRGVMNPILLILILLLLFGGGGFYIGGPAYGGGGIGLILLIVVVIYLMGGYRSKN